MQLHITDWSAFSEPYAPAMFTKTVRTAQTEFPNSHIITKDSDKGPCLHLCRNGSPDMCHGYVRKGLRLDPARMYRLSFDVKADRLPRDMVCVQIDARGPEGPAWAVIPVRTADGCWRHVELLLRPLFQYNPVTEADIRLKMYQWRPCRPEDGTPQRVWCVDIRLDEYDGGPVSLRAERFLNVPGYPDAVYADLAVAAGDGVTAGILSAGGRTQTDRLEELKPGTYAWSARARRLYLHRADAEQPLDITFMPCLCRDPASLVGLPDPSVSRLAGKEAGL